MALQFQEVEPLVWSKSQFNYSNMVRIGTIADGSCFFHAIVSAFFEPYQRGKLVNSDGQSVALDRIGYIRNLRRELSIKLEERDSSGKRYYDLLGRGKLSEFSKGYPACSLESMKKILDSSDPVDNVFNEYISNILGKDIYLLDSRIQDVYITGDDDEVLFKGRPSIVILWSPGHYELVGIVEPSGIRTLFSPDSDFIRTIRERNRFLVKRGVPK